MKGSHDEQRISQAVAYLHGRIEQQLEPAGARTTAGEAAKNKVKNKVKRRLTPEGLAKIRAASKRRWAKERESGKKSRVGRPRGGKSDQQRAKPSSSWRWD